MRQLSQRASLFIVNACNLSLSLRERWLPKADGEGFPKEIGVAAERQRERVLI